MLLQFAEHPTLFLATDHVATSDAGMGRSWQSTAGPTSAFPVAPADKGPPRTTNLYREAATDILQQKAQISGLN